MDDYIETIIYFIATILFIVVGSLGKKRKKPEQKYIPFISDNEQEQNYTKPKSIFDFLEEQVYNNYEIEENAIQDSTPALEKEPEEKVLNVEKISERAELKGTLEYEPGDDNLKAQNFTTISKEFDVKKAIIFSTILKRKYY